MHEETLSPRAARAKVRALVAEIEFLKLENARLTRQNAELLAIGQRLAARPVVTPAPIRFRWENPAH
jgi:hypothetical protein